MFVLTKYYSKERSEVLLLSFNEKSGGVQMTWAVISVAWIIIPTILFPFFLQKGKWFVSAILQNFPKT